MDFEQADRAFALLDARRRSGEMADTAYREALSDLRVTDAQGRLWAMQEQTGEWFVWENGAWQVRTPPHRVVPPPPPPPPAHAHVSVVRPAFSPAASAMPAHAPMPQPISEISATATTARSGAVAQQPLTTPRPHRGANPFGYVFPLLVWAGISYGAAFVAVNNGGEEGTAILALAAVALVVLIFILRRLGSAYEGSIEQIRIETVTDTDEDGDTTTRRIPYAYVRTMEGKVEKVQSRRSYGVGDYMVKRRGDWNPRRVKA
jgi:hypothetical protein